MYGSLQRITLDKIGKKVKFVQKFSLCKDEFVDGANRITVGGGGGVLGDEWRKRISKMINQKCSSPSNVLIWWIKGDVFPNVLRL